MMRALRVLPAGAFLTIALLLAVAVVGQSRSASKPRRATPPEFNAGQTAGTFFQDVFSEGLVGTRPDNLGDKPTVTPQPGGGSPTGPGPSGGGPQGGLYAWSKIIPATVIEDEIKSIKLQVDKDVTTPSKFRSRGYKACQVHFTMLAMLFGIVGEYDGKVRWDDTATTARDAFQRAARNSSTGSIQAYNEAKARKLDLQDLVNGQKLPGKPSAPKVEKWDEVVKLSYLMRRLETAQQARLQPWTSSANEFNSNKNDIAHEAHLAAAIAEVILRPEMDNYDDDDYRQHGLNLKKAALEAAAAARQGNAEQARVAVGQMAKACSSCHENYR